MSDELTPKKKPYEKPTLSEGALRPEGPVLSVCEPMDPALATQVPTTEDGPP
jgi:hypothetical protein